MERIYTDGSGDGRMAWYNETRKESWSGKGEDMTNNEAEYMAVYQALKAVEAKEVEILSDSQLVVNQLKREWHIKDDKMRGLFDRIQDLIKEKGLEVKFTWVRREKNPAGKYLG